MYACVVRAAMNVLIWYASSVFVCFLCVLPPPDTPLPPVYMCYYICIMDMFVQTFLCLY